MIERFIVTILQVKNAEIRGELSLLSSELAGAGLQCARRFIRRASNGHPQATTGRLFGFSGVTDQTL
jgi:hypothetical protein